MIDFSHGNSGKEPEKQVDVGHAVAGQVAQGDARIFGVMVESHLKAGRQDLIPGKQLVYGLSITDACVGWEDTRALLDSLADAVRQRRLKHRGKRHDYEQSCPFFVLVLEKQSRFDGERRCCSPTVACCLMLSLKRLNYWND